MPSQTISEPVMPRRRSTIPPRKKYTAARAFFLTIVVISIFATWQWTVGDTQVGSNPPPLVRREGIVSSDGLAYGDTGDFDAGVADCRLVHSVKDQCAYVRSNCPDEEAGLLSYLQLYYCNLHHAKPVAFVIMVLWLGLLFSTIGIAASDFFCINLSTISSVLGMSESMAGVTFLALGNGSPDVFSTFAAMKTHSGSLAVGELLGAAGFITAVVAGSMALVRPFKVARKSFVRDVGFFIVAASFSMIFLADGRLQLWECATMVGFYIFYVITVVVWHWYLQRRSRMKLQEIVARSHFHVPGTDEAVPEPYHDEEDSGPARSRQTTRSVSADDFANLERAGSPALRAIDEEFDDDETRDRYMAEISSNMRVNRARRGERRRNTINPIRPSLVGALEFRAVLSSLQKSSHSQTIPINLRRYSDDPTFSVSSNPETPADLDAHDLVSDLERPGDVDNTGLSRPRAVSTNGIAGLKLDPSVLKRGPGPQIDLQGPSPPGSSKSPPPGTPEADSVTAAQPFTSPNLLVPRSRGDYGYFASSPLSMSPAERQPSPGFLAPPGGGARESLDHSEHRHHSQGESLASPQGSPIMSGKPHMPKLDIPGASMSSHRSSTLSPFPEYRDDSDFVPLTSRTSSIRLPSSSIIPESPNFFQEPEERPLRWWPYKILPTPRVLVSTLFPSLYSWGDKNIWEKLLGIVAAPSVFLLAITLPIVEVDKDEEDQSETLDPDRSLLSPAHDLPISTATTLAVLPPDSPPEPAHNKSNPPPNPQNGNHILRSPAINITSPNPPTSPSSPRPQSTYPPPSSPKTWNRWLISTQLFTGPLLLALLYWANTTPTHPRYLLTPLLISTTTSLLLLTLLLLLTSSTTPPKHRHLLCYLGFLISIAWISTLANEVVGVLKALGTILNISDAILGLTIFAVGNSLGDLVADITVARLGYPVMALSACFGGPMLNILLGIGLGGCYMTIRGHVRRVEKGKHPVGYKPYEVEVGGSLLISGVVLLVTLLGLLVVVPMRGWWMDRRVGAGLVALWVCSTVANVVVEVWGWGRDVR